MSSPSSTSPSPSKSKKRQVDWIPLFSRSSSDLPLATTTLLPPTQPRRMSSFDQDSTSYSSGSGSQSDPESPTTTGASEYQLTPAVLTAAGQGGGGGGKTSAVNMSPRVGGEEKGIIMQRSQSIGIGGAAGAGVAGQSRLPHLRRRSSSSILIHGLIDPTSSSSSSSSMERVPSLTTYMSNPTSKSLKLPAPRTLLEHRNSTFHKAAAFDLLQRRRRLTSTLLRYVGLSLLVLLALYSLRNFLLFLQVPSLFGPRSSPSSKTPTTPAWNPPLSLYNTLETIPYPLSSHPRTPAASDSSTSFAEYLTTRLGSHFSFPPSASHPTNRQSSHLWLTTASNESIRISTPHLVAFVNQLDSRSTRTTSATNGPGEIESHATRKLVIACVDEGCLEYCREREGWFCFGGFKGEEEGEGERVKIRAAVEALESGRRVFLVDPDVYFREDPVPHLGPLQNYDMQIPDSWHSGRLNAGFTFLQPTQNLISLWRRLLTISHLPPKERLLWSTTNLLLDPFGQARDHRNPHSPSHSQKKVDEQDDAVVSGYGQTEFESSWAGGIDVRVLGRRRFRTGSGRLSKVGWEEDREEEALYHHCVCCGDLATNDYIAGSLGFHHPHASYPHLSTSSSPIPQALKTPALKGTPSELAFSLSLLLQLSADSNRIFIPPLKGTIESPPDGADKKKDKYIWRLFPLSSWSHGAGPGAHVTIKEPSYIQHYTTFLRSSSSSSSSSSPSTSLTRTDVQRQLTDLSSTLYLDLSTVQSYDQALRMMKRPFFSTTRVVFVEGVKEVRGREGWEVREEFAEGEEGVSLCRGAEEEEEGVVEGVGRDGRCVEICRA